MWLLITAAAACVAFGIGLLAMLKRLRLANEKLAYFEMINEQAPPTYFEYDIKNSRMTGSLALANLYGGYGNNYDNIVMENFPECAVTIGAVHPQDCARYLDFYGKFKAGEAEQGQIDLRVKNDASGDYIWSRVSLKIAPHETEKPTKAIGLIHDLNYTDKLTGIDNRYKFELDAAKLIAENKFRYAFVLVNLNNFKLYNEINGYPQGDKLLRHIADVVHSCIGAGVELCAHSFSDHFFLLLQYESRATLIGRLKPVLSQISAFEKGVNSHYNIVPYAGISVVSDINIPITSIIDRANLAQSEIKSKGLGNIAFFDEKIKNTMIRHNEIENSMEASLRDKHFKIYLQPKYSVLDETIVGGEALVRWIKGDVLVPPMEFIPLFEKNGFIIRLDMYMFEGVCAIIKGWLDEGIKPVPISVNFSRLHIYNANFAVELAQIADRWGVPYSLLEVEVTETIAFEDERVISKVISELSRYGFSLSIDDFGSGYSSLGMLKNLPFDVIKMDKSFFGEYTDIARAKSVVGNVIDLSKKLGITSVAEGVETRGQVDFLRELECNVVQGYYYAKPMTEEAFTAMLRALHKS